jgi:chitinase
VRTHLGGYAQYPVVGSGAYRLADVKAYRRRGGDVTVSFGGQAGAELASVCPSVDSLAAAYEAVVDAYGARCVDFDIEGGALEDAAANARRDAAIAALQKSRHVKVAFTLPGTRAHKQLHVPLKRIGVTPMIGINDVQTETFTLANAHQLHRWAARKHVGMLGMWELGRDAQCAQPSASTQITCSGVTQAPWAFAHALG